MALAAALISTAVTIFQHNEHGKRMTENALQMPSKK
jgi:hypothetical protein